MGGSEMPTRHATELTLRGVIIGIAITVVFTAANVYFGLKAGMTFATSIPAAVISMAVLRALSTGSIRENNIIQTIASSAGTLSAIIFVLPGLIMVGWWQGFPYWQTLAVCAIGGVLGVMYTIPLRRALVSQSTLPYPEGVACAEVLKTGTQNRHSAEGRAGLLAIMAGAAVAAAYAVVVATRVFASHLAGYFYLGSKGAVSGFQLSFSFALFAVGHLVGLWVGLAMALGTLIAWAWAVPHYSALAWAADGSTASAAAHAVWDQQVRFIGAGTIAVAALWALAGLLRPVAAGVRDTWVAARREKRSMAGNRNATDRDLSMGWIIAISLACLPPMLLLLWQFSQVAALLPVQLPLVGGAVVFIILISLLVAAVCAYMAGLIGSSNSPLSGIGICVVICAALLLALGIQPAISTQGDAALVAFALFVTAIVFAVATISNDNMQDLKTGQLVGATPWKQQVALMIGVAAGAAIIPPVLELLNQAYGFAGVAGADPNTALPAPQAVLISALAQGVISQQLDWSLLGIGAGIGAALIALDSLLARHCASARLPPLAVGLGIYLPTATTLMVTIGALAGWWFNHRAQRSQSPGKVRQLGVLLASGMIVGESLIGVAMAAIVVFSGNAQPLALVGSQFAPIALWLGALVFTASLVLLYRWLLHTPQRQPEPT